MSANRANIAWHLRNMIGGDNVPLLGTKGYHPGAVAIKSTGTVGNGLYVNKGTFDSCDFISTDGLSAIFAGGEEQDVHEIDTTQNYDIGSRLVKHGFGGNRTFYYAKATNIVTNIRQGLKFWNQMADGITYVAATAGAVGDTTITITAANITANALRGGFLVMHTHSDKKHQFFGITGNTATNTAGTITISLDGALSHTITSSHGVEVWLNPYNSVRLANSTSGAPGNKYSSVAGVPVRHTTVANTYLWLQTWGPCWCNTHGDIAGGGTSATDERRVVFDWEGSISIEDNAVGTTGVDMQKAGFSLDRTDASTVNGGFFMLQISP